MSLFLLDILLAVVLIGGLCLLLKGSGNGFFGVLVPYIFMKQVLVSIPIIIGIVNLVLVPFMNHSVIQASIVFIIPIVTILSYFSKEKLYERFWTKQISPIKEEVRFKMKEKGFDEIGRVQVQTFAKRKLKGELIIEVYKEDEEKLDALKDELCSFFKEKYPTLKLRLFTNTNKEKPA